MNVKLKLLVLMCMLFSVNALVSQSKPIIYEYQSFNKTKVDMFKDGKVTGFSEQRKKEINRRVNESREVTRLTIHKGLSCYKYFKTIVPKGLPPSKASYQFGADYYKNHKTKRLILTGGANLMGKCVDEPYTAINDWTIIDFDTVILNLPCKKAIENNTKHVVFFTTQIPIADGPDHYAGLPGLITMVRKENIDMVLTAIIKDKTAVPFSTPEPCEDKTSFANYSRDIYSRKGVQKKSKN